MKTILVTGGAGYVGSVLVPELLAEKYRVHVIDWFLYGDTLAPHPRLSLMKGDIRDTQLLKKALVGVDCVIHLACISNDPSFELDPRLGASINFDATKQLIDLSKKAGVSRFIYASSSSVYGVKKELEVTEDLPLEPLTDYSKYKALCEEYLFEHHDKTCTAIVLRPATVCGWSPRLRLDLTVNLLTIQALVNRKMTVFGGTQKRPNIHIRDMARAYRTMIEAPASVVDGKTYNVGYENYSLTEIAEMIRKTLGDTTIQIVYSPSKDMRSYHISSQKIEKELGFRASHTVEEAIRDLKNAFEAKKIPNPFSDIRYFNIKTMHANHSI